jgi:hypothetical protein
MRKSRLIEILSKVFHNCEIYPEFDNDMSGKLIYFKRNSMSDGIKCYTYSNIDEIELDSCVWYITVYFGGLSDDYYRIPEDDAEEFLEICRDRLINYLKTKDILDSKINDIKKLKNKDLIKSEIRSYKLNKLLK